MSNISYKEAGVDIDAGNEFVEAIKADVKSTFDKNVTLLPFIFWTITRRKDLF